MGNDTKVLLKKKRKKERTGTREESAHCTLGAFTKLWLNLNIVSSVTKQANTFLRRGCAIADIVWFGLSFRIFYRRAAVTPTLHACFCPLTISLNLFALTINFSSWMYARHVSGSVKHKLMFETTTKKKKFHSLQTRGLSKVSINIWTRT